MLLLNTKDEAEAIDQFKDINNCYRLKEVYNLYIPNSNILFYVVSCWKSLKILSVTIPFSLTYEDQKNLFGLCNNLEELTLMRTLSISDMENGVPDIIYDHNKVVSHGTLRKLTIERMVFQTIPKLVFKNLQVLKTSHINICTNIMLFSPQLKSIYAINDHSLSTENNSLSAQNLANSVPKLKLLCINTNRESDKKALHDLRSNLKYFTQLQSLILMNKSRKLEKPNLKPFLYIDGFHIMSISKFFLQFKNLQFVDISMSDANDKIIHTILMNNYHIKYLNICDTQCTSDVFKNLVLPLLSLETLALGYLNRNSIHFDYLMVSDSCCYYNTLIGIENIFPNLKYLRAVYSEYNCNKVFKIIKSQTKLCSNLQEIDIGIFEELSKDLLEMLICCTNLKKSFTVLVAKRLISHYVTLCKN